LIIGNGMAGITAAQAIRHADPCGRIQLVSDEGEPYYYRASLCEWIAGEIDETMLPGRTPAFYRQMGIEQTYGHVTHVAPEVRRVELADGGALRYDRLLIATGARANIYPVEGLDEVLVFRGLADARRIRERLVDGGRALIVGGGVLGLELAGALQRMAIADIAVVQRTPPLAKPLLDQAASAWVQERMRADGVDVFVGDTVERVVDGTAYLKSGSAWDVDVLVEAVGITPTFPEVPGLAVGRGIRIDQRCRTNLPDVYAAGDCAETRAPGTDRWQPTRIWLECAQQGKVAGRNMAGREATLPDEPYFNASLLYTVRYAFIGRPHGTEGEAHVWQKDDGYRKVRVVDGRLAGALLLGERHGAMALHRAIDQPVARFGAGVARPEFAWNDLSSQDWDYLFY
jgi:NAD(P)H-nitrite reductase large subunit